MHQRFKRNVQSFDDEMYNFHLWQYSFEVQKSALSLLKILENYKGKKKTFENDIFSKAFIFTLVVEWWCLGKLQQIYRQFLLIPEGLLQQGSSLFSSRYNPLQNLVKLNLLLCTNSWMHYSLPITLFGVFANKATKAWKYSGSRTMIFSSSFRNTSV